MFARQKYIRVQPGEGQGLRRLFAEQVAPIIRKQRGIVDQLLLELPEKDGSEFISLTLWESRADAERYERSAACIQIEQRISAAAAAPRPARVAQMMPMRSASARSIVK